MEMFSRCMHYAGSKSIYEICCSQKEMVKQKDSESSSYVERIQRKKIKSKIKYDGSEILERIPLKTNLFKKKNFYHIVTNCISHV